MEEFLSLRVPEFHLPDLKPSAPQAPLPLEPAEPTERPANRCAKGCFKMFRFIFWANVALLTAASVQLVPAFIRHLAEKQPHLTVGEIRVSAYFWYLFLVTAPIVVTYLTHNVRRWR
jgi:hypothetical protein